MAKMFTVINRNFIFLTFSILACLLLPITNATAQTYQNGQLVNNQCATLSSGGYQNPTLGCGKPNNGAGTSVFDSGTTYHGIFSYAETFSAGTSIAITARYKDFRTGGIYLNVPTHGTNLALIGGFGAASASPSNTLTNTLPTTSTGIYKFIPLQDYSANTYLNIDAIQNPYTKCAQFTATTFVDNGDGSGTKNNCTKDDAKSISPADLYINVLQSTILLQPLSVTNRKAPIKLPDGTYTIMITNSPTKTITVLPAVYLSSSHSKTIVTSDGVLTSASAPFLICLQLSDTYDDETIDLQQITLAQI